MVKEAKNMNVDESEKKEKKERKRREKQKDGDSLKSDSGKKSTDFEENSSGSVVNEGHKKRKRKERVVECEEKSSVDGTSEGEKRKKRKKEKDVDGVELLVEDVVDRVDEKVVDGTSRSEKKKKKKKSKREERKDREFEIIDGNGEGGENEEASSLGKNKPSGSHDKGTVNTASGSEQKKSNKEKKDGDILKLVLENLTDSIDEKDSSSGKKEPSRSHDKGSGSKKMKGNEKEEEEKKKKKKKKKDGDNSKSLLENAVGSLKKKHAVSQEKGVVNDASGSEKKRKKKDSQDGNRLPKKTKTTNADDLGAKTSSSSKKKSNRVTFKGDVEEFPPLEDDDVSKYDENNLIRGKRFSPEEDQLIRDSVYKYIEVNQLGEEGLQKVLKSGRYPDVRGCWKEIAAALPWRPYEAVYGRGTTILMMSEKRGFTEEENDIIRKFHAEHGPQWHKLAQILGKHRMHIKDAWRRIRLPNVKKGNWSQDEYQGLFDLVNLNLRIKAFDQRKTKNVMIRENISWEAISDKLTTRTMSTLCHKWLAKLATSTVNVTVKL